MGRRPIPIGAEIARSNGTDQEAGKVALGSSATEADAHTFASLRSLQKPRVLPFVLSRAAALDAASSGAAAASLLSQLETASFCSRSTTPSPLRGHACSLNAPAQRTRVRLVPGSMPAHADPCGGNVSYTGREELPRCVLPLTAYSAVTSTACTEHITDRIASFSVPHVMGSHVLWCCIHT